MGDRLGSSTVVIGSTAVNSLNSGELKKLFFSQLLVLVCSVVQQQLSWMGVSQVAEVCLIRGLINCELNDLHITGRGR